GSLSGVTRALRIFCGEQPRESSESLPSVSVEPTKGGLSSYLSFILLFAARGPGYGTSRRVRCLGLLCQPCAPRAPLKGHAGVLRERRYAPADCDCSLGLAWRLCSFGC